MSNRGGGELSSEQHPIGSHCLKQRPIRAWGRIARCIYITGSGNTPIRPWWVGDGVMPSRSVSVSSESWLLVCACPALTQFSGPLAPRLEEGHVRAAESPGRGIKRRTPGELRVRPRDGEWPAPGPGRGGAGPALASGRERGRVRSRGRGRRSGRCTARSGRTKERFRTDLIKHLQRRDICLQISGIPLQYRIR